ncbi:hypothetical protein EJ08DRAFT_19245 [Tothia fuscella]|uniref:Uncharacterized protein n=1 Tax=Tothia fuscella TaxID=1048955 RepID=A0A9P4NYE2_9PEZI|nr:hypothetical protein EJ08DRAFT_19245 [Tothia fuscella]
MYALRECSQIVFRNSSCVALSWSQLLKTLHHKHALDILGILPLPIIITASKCAREGIQKYLRGNLESLSLKNDLSFKAFSLRIMLFTAFFSMFCHPTAGFRREKNKSN